MEKQMKSIAIRSGCIQKRACEVRKGEFFPYIEAVTTKDGGDVKAVEKIFPRAISAVSATPINDRIVGEGYLITVSFERGYQPISWPSKDDLISIMIDDTNAALEAFQEPAVRMGYPCIDNRV